MLPVPTSRFSLAQRSSLIRSLTDAVSVKLILESGENSGNTSYVEKFPS
jgi:hypothetical protein